MKKLLIALFAVLLTASFTFADDKPAGDAPKAEKKAAATKTETAKTKKKTAKTAAEKETKKDTKKTEEKQSK